MTSTMGPASSEAPSTDPGAPDRVAAGIDPASDILTLRAQIDALDAAIVSLVAERSRLSHRIQNVRLHAGGTRVELGRERVILAHYRDALGPDGPHLADAVLQVCRGRR